MRSLCRLVYWIAGYHLQCQHPLWHGHQQSVSSTDQSSPRDGQGRKRSKGRDTARGRSQRRKGAEVAGISTPPAMDSRAPGKTNSIERT